MVKYLKFILIVFGTIGLCAATFFYLQNKNDISVSLEYKSKIDYDHLKENCRINDGDYMFPCIKNEYKEFLTQVSLTGTSIGLKMVFNVMDKDRALTSKFKNEDIKSLHFSINYLEVNNLALNNAYKRYFGFDGLYGGFISSLPQYYKKAYEFSDNLILGLEGVDGIKKVKDPQEFQNLNDRLEAAKAEYYKTKDVVQDYLDAEFKRLTDESKSE